MLLEATMAMFLLMGITWAGAVWASYQKQSNTFHQSLVNKYPANKAA